jgi:hypothetical protein
MSMITAILEPDVNGTIHLTLPPELRSGNVVVTATELKVSNVEAEDQYAPPYTAEDMPRLREILAQGFRNKKSDGPAMAAALEAIAKNGGAKSIPDPVAWQREIRKDKPQPGREE